MAQTEVQIAASLNERQREVLAAVVLNYALSGSPVGSRTVSRSREDGLSAATIRNTMSELEEMGLLSQPHTSAGRIPTDSGYRYYVDSMMSGQPLSTEDIAGIRRSLLAHGKPGEVDALLHRTVRLLADMSSQVGLVLTPRFTHAVLRRLDFHGLPEQQVLAVFVSQSGIVHHTVIRSPEPLSATDLVTISNMVNENFAGLTLPDIRARLLQEMKREKALYDRLLSRALQLCRSYLEHRNDDDHEVLVDGTANVLARRDFSDVGQMKTLFREFEEKNRLVQLLNSCLDADRPQIRIGSECHDPALSDVTLITAPYRYREQPVGALGIVGPRRMPYDRLVTLVTSLSGFLSEALAQRAVGIDTPQEDGENSDE